MSDEDAFLAALKANPADDLTRLVYADWLDDRDETAKGQYLRAVVELTQLPGGTPEYNDAAGRLYTACFQTEEMWRCGAAGRFDVILESYEDKIYTIKLIRELTGFGLAESKALAESVPTALYSWLPFERALPRLLAFSWRGSHSPRFPIGASIRPTALPAGESQGVVFDVLLAEFDIGSGPDDLYWRNRTIQGLAGLLGISMMEAHNRVATLPTTLATGLLAAEVADFVRRVKMACNVFRAVPPDTIRVVPRVPKV